MRHGETKTTSTGNKTMTELQRTMRENGFTEIAMRSFYRGDVWVLSPQGSDRKTWTVRMPGRDDKRGFRSWKTAFKFAVEAE